MRAPRHRILWAAATLGLGIVGCEATTQPSAVDGDLPSLLSGLNIEAPGAVYFEPTWALWTNGSIKSRTVRLSQGGTIDITDRSAWEFPEGARFVKTFSYLTQSSPITPRPVETRIIRKRDGAWETAAYLWREDLSDAELLGSAERAEVPIVDAEGRVFTHIVPNSTDCQTCHGANPTFIIGFSELQLNSPLPGEGVTQLERLRGEGFFNELLPNSFKDIPAGDPLTRQVLGYVHANCVHCHNPGSNRLDLSPDLFIANTVNQFSIRRSILIEPGDPDGSQLYVWFSEGIMPPLGVQRGDSVAREMMREWIATY